MNIRSVWSVTAKVSKRIKVESLIHSKDRSKDKSFLPCHEDIGIGRCFELFDHDLPFSKFRKIERVYRSSKNSV